jgi:hypothetical protein
MPIEWSARALVCEGVRAALALILADVEVALPRDVYPVYWQLAKRAVAFDTFPTFTLPDARYVVMPCPLKLHGRAWTAQEFAHAKAWLRADPQRRLILDGVYSFADPLTAGVLELVATDQAILVDSMSKGWLHEKVFGTALVPEQDVARWTPMFRAAPPSQAALFTARALLERDVPLDLAARCARTIDKLAERGIAASAPERGYLIPVDLDPEVALSRGVLLIPFSVFGGTRPTSFASAL